MFSYTESHNQTGINYLKENWYAQKVCYYIIDCQDSKIMDYCKALILAFVVLKVTERLFNVVNVWFHHNACDRKNKIMRMKAFQHVLTLDQAYFDNHSASAIRGSMNAHAINNLITWNIPYLVTLNLQFFMTAIYMLRIGKLHLFTCSSDQTTNSETANLKLTKVLIT